MLGRLSPKVLAGRHQSRIGKMEQVASAAEGAAHHDLDLPYIHQIVPTIANAHINSFARYHADERQHPDLWVIGHSPIIALIGDSFK
jgi:hypothetical protein